MTFPHSLLCYSQIRGQFSDSPLGMISRTLKMLLGSFNNWCDGAWTKPGWIFPLLTCGHTCQEGNSKDGHSMGDSEAASLHHLRAELVCWRENHCTAASAQGSQGLIPAAIRHPGESPTAGTGSPGNEPSPLLQGIFQFRADSRGFYVSNLHYMSLLSLITCQAGEPISGSGSTGLTLGRVSGEAPSAGKCTVLSLPYL